MSDKIPESGLSDGGEKEFNKLPVFVVEEKTAKLLGDWKSLLLKKIGDCVTVSPVEIPIQNSQRIFSIEVTNEKKWKTKETMEKIVPFFGDLILGAFAPRDEKNNALDLNTESVLNDCFLEGDIGIAEKIYVIADNDAINGLLMMSYKELTDGSLAASPLLVVVDPQKKHLKLGENLYRAAFVESNVSAFFGVSHTPAAVKLREKIGRENSFRTYFCGKSFTNPNETLNPHIRKQIELNEIIKQDAKSYGYGDLQTKLPLGYVSYGTDGIPPRKLEELNFPDRDPLGEIFKELVLWQTQNRPSETIYGTLISIKD